MADEAIFLTPTQERVLRAASLHPQGELCPKLYGAAWDAVVGYLVRMKLAVVGDGEHPATRITVAGLNWIEAMDELDGE